MFHYELNCEQYVLTDDKGEHHSKPLDEVSVAFSREHDAGDKPMYILNKYGNPDLITAWHAKMVDRYRDSGFDDYADNMFIVTGKFDVDVLNRVLDTTGYIGKFLAHHDIVLPQSNTEASNEELPAISPRYTL